MALAWGWGTIFNFVSQLTKLKVGFGGAGGRPRGRLAKLKVGLGGGWVDPEGGWGPTFNFVSRLTKSKVGPGAGLGGSCVGLGNHL